MLPPDLQALLTSVGFRDPDAARTRLHELAEDAAELLALAQISCELEAALVASADPDRALRNLSRFVHARGSRLALYHIFRDDPAGLERLIRVLAGSRYLADVLVRNPEFLDVVADSVLLGSPRTGEELMRELGQVCAPFPSPAAQLDAVRRYRRREILRIGAADLCGMLDLRQTTEQLSRLADAVVDQCLRIVAGPDYPGGLIVLGLGKLGGGELNYSSDIDLVFVTERADDLEAATRTAQVLTGALASATGEGFLYRVDLRLRPHGGSGALVVSADALRAYLEASAHPAERQAMLKARAIAGDIKCGQAVLEQIKPIVYQDSAAARTHVRSLKDRIERQLRARGEAAGHVKLARGGIRDIEFLVQALQLEAGPANAAILAGNTLDALDRLAAAGLLACDDAAELREAYVFLRLVEHRLQLMDNQQVHRLPEAADELGHLARTLGISGPDEPGKLQAAYAARSACVRAIFERVLIPVEHIPVEQASRLPKQQAATSVEPPTRLLQPGSRDPLATIQQPGDVAVCARRESDRQWTVTVAMWDHIGVLSVLTGLFTAWQVNILSGDVRSLCMDDVPDQSAFGRQPRRGRPSGAARRKARKAFDTFVVQLGEWVEKSFWQAFERELAELVRLMAEGSADAARERIIDRISRAARQSQQPLAPFFPIHIELDNDADGDATQLVIRSTDTPGFLFEFAAALALLNVNIQRVEIRTIHHEVHDTFYVTDARGRKIVDPDRLHELRVAAALIKQFTHLLPRSPDPAQALRQFSALARQMLSRPDWVADVQSLQSDAVLRTLADLMGVSQFLWEDFLREQHENLFPVLRDIPALEAAKTKEQLRAELEDSFRQPGGALEAVGEFSAAGGSALRAEIAALNRFKDREMFRIDLRRITRRIDLDQFSRELADLAEVVVARACELSRRQLALRLPPPQRAAGEACRWCVCGLGKFGGRELGFASDIELIFVYDGEAAGGGSAGIASARYFEEFVAAFLGTLIVRREGVFEIDLRLRPHGKAGTLASSLAGFSQYFSTGGPAQQYERLALVKLRPVAGDPDLAARVLAARDAFVYSPQPLDDENILHLRHRQATELVPPRSTSAKHSPGGLVDLEYFIQARQIEVGRSDESVRVTGTQEAIARLCDAGALTAEEAARIADAYRFLRELIEALRVVHGHAKDLTIPGAASRQFEHLARRMGYESPAALAHQIEQKMAFARGLWKTRNGQ